MQPNCGLLQRILLRDYGVELGSCYAVKIVEKHQLEIRGMLGRLYQEVNVQRSLCADRTIGRKTLRK